VTTIDVGDVIAVRTGGWAAALIRTGEFLRGIDDDDNHIAVMHHWNNDVPWGLEGRPGGVGWVDLRVYLGSKWTVTNAAQPKTPAQRQGIAADAEAMLRCGYDYTGIFGDACIDLGLPELWPLDWHGKGSPGHVVCSSYAAYLYVKRKLAAPEPGVNDRWWQPGDWRGWAR
jgi:hypothetical protein